MGLVRHFWLRDKLVSYDLGLIYQNALRPPLYWL